LREERFARHTSSFAIAESGLMGRNERGATAIQARLQITGDRDDFRHVRATMIIGSIRHTHAK